ncbi:flagellar basal body L-ring protein FlgH [Hypnocyclicus thermotrophus]|uniref:Flagellar basal body L-ring protein FlgH n=1 Tax=Hypnocyclicus thermotrophus TaxID=1627895 RepID=A0AA46I5X1_9FUSO|nr:flagellar basal body L-ring protein FlgH [Hypnocyclicus thermotrophus]TDT71802.1 flagellar basal body L-ring protein FlgH [Hypnocyclicus thermotrophus]
MKLNKIIILFLIVIVASCTNTNPLINTAATVKGLNKNSETAEYPTEKASRIAEMPDISVFFPEDENKSKDETNSLWNIEQNSLYSDGRANKKGDILFILINEEATAKLTYSNAKTGFTNYRPVDDKIAKETTSTSQATNPRDKNIAKDKIEETTDTTPKPDSNSFDGTGDQSRGASYTGKIAARVEDVDKYGNLFIRGTKTTLLNNEIVTLEVTGYIRPNDIEIDNTIDSKYIENMEFSYNGAMYVGKPKITNIGDNKQYIEEKNTIDNTQNTGNKTNIEEKNTIDNTQNTGNKTNIENKRKKFLGIF